ncbi:E3 ubiquitin ligase family protein [Synechococcus elongatus IITB7]|uniref:E3 ubiquitin ligase family protein n=1 Tax=Synechococcus elongatus TaxID=32046 RepID=UPI0030CFDB36
MAAILAAVTAIAAIVLYFVRRHYRIKLQSLLLAQPANSRQLKEIADHVAGEIGAGSLRQYVKMWGAIEVDQPLISELKEEPCVYYSFTVSREYEERVRQEDSEGKVTWTTERRSETISQNRRSTPFYLRDQHGRIRVEPEAASIATIPVLDEFRPTSSTNSLSFGGFSLSLSVNGGTGKTLGYRYREEILPCDRSILVVGAASDETGELTLGPSAEARQQFFIALKPENAVLQEVKQTIQWLSIGGIASAGVAAISAIAALLKLF